MRWQDFSTRACHLTIVFLGDTLSPLLNEGMIYSDILTATGASSATISRVNRSLNDYGTGAYRELFKRLEEKNK